LAALESGSLPAPAAKIGLDMTEHIPDELSPAGGDMRAYTDELRHDYPVVRNDRGEWVLLRHDLVRRAALDHISFSSAVSRFLQVPNGLDGQEHTAFREELDPFLSPAALVPYQKDFAHAWVDYWQPSNCELWCERSWLVRRPSR
jgi:cytochrome P450